MDPQALCFFLSYVLGLIVILVIDEREQRYRELHDIRSREYEIGFADGVASDAEENGDGCSAEQYIAAMNWEWRQ